LDEEITIFIYKIRNFFSELIDNNEQDLTKAKISLFEFCFPKISTITEKKVEDKTEKHTPQNNLKISEILTIDLNWSDGELIDQISSFHNSQMIEFLNYIYDKIPSNFKI
jgi:hypothetical protein